MGMRVLHPNKEDYTMENKLNTIVGILNHLDQENVYRVKDTYLTYPDSKWTTIIKNNNVQILTPAQWTLIEQTENNEKLIPALAEIANNIYCGAIYEKNRLTPEDINFALEEHIFSVISVRIDKGTYHYTVALPVDQYPITIESKEELNRGALAVHIEFELYGHYGYVKNEDKVAIQNYVKTAIDKILKAKEEENESSFDEISEER